MTTPDETVEGLARVIHAARGFSCLQAGDVSFCESWAEEILRSDWLAAYVAEREAAVLREAAERMTRADKTLRGEAELHWMGETVRLEGKAAGVRLARSYVDELLRERAGRVGGRS